MTREHEPTVEPADEQQAQLVDSLRAAGGAPVSFEELRCAGIENPASLCYELEAAGLPISRVHRHDATGPSRPDGVRLEEPDGGPQLTRSSASQSVHQAVSSWIREARWRGHIPAPRNP
ncbi:MAG TPA: hypothetical protein VII79_09260, partial [Candidatus Dormibacteraeota bacterium]